MKIDNVSESFTGSSKTESTFMPPCSTTAMDIIDELPVCDKRKRNIIVYNLPEPSGKSNSDAFAALCSSVYSSSFSHFQSLHHYV